MARTRRRVPHWVKQSEQYDQYRESLGLPPLGRKHWLQREARFSLRKRVESGNFDMSDNEAQEDEERRRKMAAEAYDKLQEE